jgi:putative ABC transport system permease protein
MAHAIRKNALPGFRRTRAMGDGLLVGTLAALLQTRFLASAVFGVVPHDPWVFGAALGILAPVGFVSAQMPVVRATRLDPVRVLRSD